MGSMVALVLVAPVALQLALLASAVLFLVIVLIAVALEIYLSFRRESQDETT